MAKEFYLPNGDQERAAWLSNFAQKLPTHAATLAVTPAEQTSAAGDAAMFSYMVNLVETFTTEKEERVSYKNLLRDGPLGAPAGNFPALPAIPAPPALVLPGIFSRIRQLVQRIKNHPAYTESMGKDLGIVGADQNSERSTLKPDLKLRLSGGSVQVIWKKSTADAIRIECDRGTGASPSALAAPAPSPAWQLVGIDTQPDFTDTTPITAPAVWKYRAIYLIKDEPVGQWSDVASITVG